MPRECMFPHRCQLPGEPLCATVGHKAVTPATTHVRPWQRRTQMSARGGRLRELPSRRKAGRRGSTRFAPGGPAEITLAPIVLIKGPEGLLVDRALDRLRALAHEADPNLERTDINAATYQAGQLDVIASPSLFWAGISHGHHPRPRDHERRTRERPHRLLRGTRPRRVDVPSPSRWKRSGARKSSTRSPRPNGP